MFGRATILLERAPDRLSLPLSCLSNKTEDGKADVYVVRDGKAWRVRVRTGSSNGVRVNILKGLSAGDLVVSSAAGTLNNGGRVEVATPPSASAAEKGKT